MKYLKIYENFKWDFDEEEFYDTNSTFVTDWRGNNINKSNAVWCEFDKTYCLKDEAEYIDLLGFYTIPLKENIDIQEDWDETPDDYSILDDLEKLPIEYKKYQDEINDDEPISSYNGDNWEKYENLVKNIEEYYKKLLKSIFEQQGKDKTIELYNKIKNEFNKDKYYDSGGLIMFNITEYTRNLIKKI